MGLSLFQTSTLGMMSQAHALNTIGSNIANVSTGGFKATETRFQTVLSKTVGFQSDLGGVKPKDFQIIDQQGQLLPTERDLDLAIAGDGFFQVSPTQAVSGEIFFTRDGSFEVNFAGTTVPTTADDGSIINVRQGFLTDKNGFFVLGVTPQADGTFSETSALQSLRVDQFAISNQSSQTANARLDINLPGNNKFGDPNENTSLTVIDSNGKLRALTASFIKTNTPNQWQMVFSGDDLLTSPAATTLTFDGNGTLTSPTSTLNIALTWGDDVSTPTVDESATSNFTLDLSNSTQFAGGFLLVDFSQDGLANSSLKNVIFDQAGHVVGIFEDGSSRKIYKIPLATFSNANGLEFQTGNVFAESEKSGAARTVFADTSGRALFASNTVELSNVELADQFTQMIRVQQAYNSSATVFKTVDEMLQGARDLKV